MAQVPKAPPPAYSVSVENGVQSQPEQGEAARTNNESQGFLVTMNVINSLTHMLLGSITISALIYANWISDFSTIINRRFLFLTKHIYLTVFGYVILMAQAILTYNPHNAWSNNLKYPQKRTLHAVMQICGSILAITGGSIGMVNTSFNLGSTHGVFGFIAMVLTVVSLLGGIYHLIFPTKMRSAFLRTSHACVGLLTIISAFIALCLGFEKGRETLGDTNINLFITSTVFALAGILIVSCRKIFTRGYK